MASVMAALGGQSPAAWRVGIREPRKKMGRMGRMLSARVERERMRRTGMNGRERPTLDEMRAVAASSSERPRMLVASVGPKMT